ncbi:MAG: DUF481 domain-containing protein [Deltaproteobacteria bacterium]|nr:DUF481 domain-containing protein [Deltaproteobacteria bacterium]
MFLQEFNKISGLCIAFTVLLAADPAWAIVNVMDKGDQKSETGLTGEVNGSLSLRSGNKNWLNLDVGLNLTYRLYRHTFILKGSLEHQAGALNSLEPQISESFEHFRYRYEFLDDLFVESFVQHQFDQVKRIKLRFLHGIGVRFIHSFESVEITMGTTWMLEYEKEEEEFWDCEDGEACSQWVHRWSSYLTVDWEVMENIFVGTTNFIQPLFANLYDWRLLNDNYIEFRANKWLAMRSSYTLEYDSYPAPRVVHQLDTRIRASIVVRFE